ncbi:MAG: DUF92 domain-containing protein [Terriglobia bacterium]|jgi:uncharacterized protein (TIGR00297 family)
MPELPGSETLLRAPLFSTRKIVHMSMLSFAFLLPYLTWTQAAGCALLALLFNLVVLPRLDVDLRKGTAAAPPAGVRTGIVIYPISVLALILLYRHAMYVVGATWAILALGDGLAGVAGSAWRGPTLPWNRGKTWSGFLAFLVAGTAGAYVLTRWTAPTLAPDFALRVCAATALVGALVESAPIRLDDNATVPLVAGAFMFCVCFVERSALDSNLPYLGRRILLAVVISLALAGLAWGLKLVTPSGALSGFLLGVAVYLGYGYKSFLLMFTFFLMGSAATRLGYARKAARGVAEKRGGARSWREALANSLAGAFFSILVITTHHEGAFLIALIAAFAEAAGDTVSSEIGQWISPRAYLITTFRPVPAGQDGGVSVGGSLAGFLASALVVALGYGMGLCGRGGAALALSGAVAGNLLDSVLGATLERRGLVTNGIVNFAGSSFAGGLALAIALHIGF